jgi:general secretion pathway protein G
MQLQRKARRDSGAGVRLRCVAGSGFTLIEMMVVIAIIGTLAMLVGPSVLRNVGDANATAARSQIETLAVALDAYRLDVGAYPTTEEGLSVLRVRPLTGAAAGAWRGPYLRKRVPADPWGRPYVYQSPGRHNPDSYDLYTLGRDGEPGGRGEKADITSWGEDLTP